MCSHLCMLLVWWSFKYLNNFLHSSDSKVIGLLPHPAASVFWAYNEVQGRAQVFHNCLTICQWIKRYDCNNICNFDSVRNKRGINVSCWTSWFDKLWWLCHMLGKYISGIRISKILLGEDPDPPHGLRNFGARRVGLHTTYGLPPKPKILATPLPHC